MSSFAETTVARAIPNDEIHTFFIHYFSSSFHIQPHKIMAVNLTHFFSCYQRAVIVFIAPRAAPVVALQIKLPLDCPFSLSHSPLTEIEWCFLQCFIIFAYVNLLFSKNISLIIFIVIIKTWFYIPPSVEFVYV